MAGSAGPQEAGTARCFFAQLRRQLGGTGPRGSGAVAAAAGGSAALAGALHMPRALCVASNPGPVACTLHMPLDIFA